MFRGVRVAAVAACGIAAGCSGGGDGGGPIDDGGNGGGSGITYTPGIYAPASTYAAQCATPRTGTDPATGRAYPDRRGSVAAENFWLRSWTNELYLWYAEVQDRNPNSYTDPLDYFDLLRTTAVTASGQDKDKFHFTYDSDDWYDLTQSGVEAGYGIVWYLAAATPPRRIIVAYSEPGSPAAAASVTRGAEVLSVDGADAINGNTQAIVDTLNAGLFPSAAGESHTLRIRDVNGGERTITLQSANVTSTPVPTATTISAGGATVGYLVFHDHIVPSETQLATAIASLRDAGATDLILDIRYNGGGYLDIASELAYMIAGPARTTGATFERITFNDKYPNTNPVTGQALTPTGFHTTTQFSTPAGQTLPTLNLDRVYILTGSGTCSASEAIINGLRGVGVQVYQIGNTTCGKPYGFYAFDNCGTTYFSIQFKGTNAQGFGDYTDGFSPSNTTGVAGTPVPGCAVADDFTRPLGDPQERRLAAALSFRAGNNLPAACPAPSSVVPDGVSKSSAPANEEGIIVKSPWRTNRILRDM